MRLSFIERCASVLLIVVLLSEGPDVLAAETRFTIVNSSQSSWVAHGYHDYTVSPSVGWTFRTNRYYQNGVGFDISGAPLRGTTVDDWNLNLTGQNGGPITPETYSDFRSLPSHDHPSLEFGSTGRLDGEAEGVFEVYEATYGAGGDLLSFAADFTHYGERDPNNWAVAEIRYNATVPEPQGLGAIAVGALAVARRGRRGRCRIIDRR